MSVKKYEDFGMCDYNLKGFIIEIRLGLFCKKDTIFVYWVVKKI